MMGLDTYAARSPGNIELTEEDIQAFQEADISLCGGLFSGDGNDGSFRGKVYVMLVLEITARTLPRIGSRLRLYAKCMHPYWHAVRKKPFANMT
jgi:hypothetical protein